MKVSLFSPLIRIFNSNVATFPIWPNSRPGIYPEIFQHQLSSTS